MTIGQISPGRFDQMGGTVTAVTLVFSTESNAAESDNCDAGRPLACQRFVLLGGREACSGSDHADRTWIVAAGAGPGRGGSRLAAV